MGSERLSIVLDATSTIRRLFVDEFHSRHIPQIPEGSRVLDLGGDRIKKRGAFNIENYRIISINGGSETHPHDQPRLSSRARFVTRIDMGGIWLVPETRSRI